MADENRLAEFVAERAANDPKVHKILEDVRLFDGLQEHPGWKRLYEHVKSSRSRFLLALTKRQMAGEEVSQREIDFNRGFFQGALWALGHPDQAMTSLERAARQAWLAAELEVLTEEEGDSPYV